MGENLDARILQCLEEKPMSISEIARELDEKKYEISKRIDVLEENDHIKTHKIGRSTACLLNEEQDHDGQVRQEQDDHPPDDYPEENKTEPEIQPPAPPDQEQTDIQTSTQPQVMTSLVDPTPLTNTAGQGQNPSLTQLTTPQPDHATLAPDNQAAAQQEQGQARPHTGPRTIGIVSGKGGVGKTVVTLNLGAAMQEFDENVIVMDADAEMSNLGIQLGIQTYPTSLTSVVEQDAHIMSAMHIDKDSGLRLIPTSLAAESVEEDVSKAFDKIPNDYIVLVDSPPGFERPIKRVIDTCDELIFVTTPEVPAVTDTYKLYKEAQRQGKDILGVIINMYSSPKKHLSVKEVEEAVEMPVLGVINESGVVQKSILDNKPAVTAEPHSKFARSVKEIAAELTGNEYKVSLLDRVRGLLP
jgi:MinD-like ATPase involved in chromosome partitioning or flagellar assembly